MVVEDKYFEKRVTPSYPYRLQGRKINAGKVNLGKGKTMAKKIAWVSQHAMHGAQMGALRRMYGDDVAITADARPFDSAETIVKRVRDGGFDDCIVVAPYSVLARMCDLGLRPLWAESEIVDQSRADWSVKSRHYRFTGFRRVKRMVLELEEIGPDAVRKDGD
jgi:hypothetical protein